MRYGAPFFGFGRVESANTGSRQIAFEAVKIIRELSWIYNVPAKVLDGAAEKSCGRLHISPEQPREVLNAVGILRIQLAL